MAGRGIRSSVVRLPRTVHGNGDHHGFIARLVGIARDKRVAGYGDGSSHCPAVHVLDAAHLFRLAVAQAPARSVLHGVADEGVPIREIAAVIGRNLNLPTASVLAGDFGFLGQILAVTRSLRVCRLGRVPAGVARLQAAVVPVRGQPPQRSQIHHVPALVSGGL
jgi:nucleoside-diphosphate-sugar epimerase